MARIYGDSRCELGIGGVWEYVKMGNLKCKLVILGHFGTFWGVNKWFWGVVDGFWGSWLGFPSLWKCELGGKKVKNGEKRVIFGNFL